LARKGEWRRQQQKEDEEPFEKGESISRKCAFKENEGCPNFKANAQAVEENRFNTFKGRRGPGAEKWKNTSYEGP